MRKLFLAGLFAVISIVAVESFSSYVLYRAYAVSHKSLHPSGSATYILLKRILVSKILGRHSVLERWADHGPIFGPDPILGYKMYPGNYLVTERLDGMSHQFRIDVDKWGRRSTSYIPVRAPHTIYVTGDSGMFGWGLDDEQTLPWLLQGRLPNFQVVNLSVSGYSTVHALLQLKHIVPSGDAGDILVMAYHDLTNELNVRSPKRLREISIGLEWQLSDKRQMSGISLPFGAIDTNGSFLIRRIDLSCARGAFVGRCAHPALSESASWQVTERAFDKIISMRLGRLVLAVTSASDSDPVVEYLRSKGVLIADLRIAPDAPDANDVIPTDYHAGAFHQHAEFLRLLDALKRDHLVE